MSDDKATKIYEIRDTSGYHYPYVTYGYCLTLEDAIRAADGLRPVDLPSGGWNYVHVKVIEHPIGQCPHHKSEVVWSREWADRWHVEAQEDKWVINRTSVRREGGAK